MKQYFEVEIEKTTVKTYRIELAGGVSSTLEYIGANIYDLERDHNPVAVFERDEYKTIAITYKDSQP